MGLDIYLDQIALQLSCQPKTPDACIPYASLMCHVLAFFHSHMPRNRTGAAIHAHSQQNMLLRFFFFVFFNLGVFLNSRVQTTSFAIYLHFYQDEFAG